MIDLFNLKTLLGEEADLLTIDEIEFIRDFEYTIADALFENWLAERLKHPKEKLEIYD